MAETYSFRIRLNDVAPADPLFTRAGTAVRSAFLRAVVAWGLEAKDREAAEGLDRFGAPLTPISRYTREHRHSAMGPADPNAPPLIPAHALSRTRSLLRGRAHADGGYALFFWRFDPISGKHWGKVLGYHREGEGRLPVRDVIGIAHESLDYVRERGRLWWIRYQATGVVPLPVEPPAPVPPLVPPPFVVRTLPAYVPKHPENAVPKVNQRVSHLEVNGKRYTMGTAIGGNAQASAASVREQIANGSFSGWRTSAERGPRMNRPRPGGPPLAPPPGPPPGGPPPPQRPAPIPRPVPPAVTVRQADVPRPGEAIPTQAATRQPRPSPAARTPRAAPSASIPITVREARGARPGEVNPPAPKPVITHPPAPSPPSSPPLSRASIAIDPREEPKVRETSARIFGRDVSPAELATLGGAPDNATVHTHAADGGGLRIDWRTPKAWANREITIDHRGKIDVHNAIFKVEASERGKGTSITAFTYQVEMAKALGADTISLQAARGTDFIGYNVWPKFGFDGPIPAWIPDRPPSLASARTVLDLFMTAEGRAWWEIHGNSVDLTFDLAAGSRSRRVWDAYRAAKEKLLALLKLKSKGREKSPTSPPKTSN